jgi:hypothetical protein
MFQDTGVAGLPLTPNGNNVQIVVRTAGSRCDVRARRGLRLLMRRPTIYRKGCKLFRVRRIDTSTNMPAMTMIPPTIA